MPTLNDELQELKTNQQNADADVKKISKSIEDSQLKLSEANAKRASLSSRITEMEKLKKGLDKATSDLQDEQERTEAEMAAIAKSAEQLSKHFEIQLTEKQRTALQDNLMKVDGAIEGAREKADQLRSQVAEAEGLLTTAKQKASAAEAEYQKAFNDFVQHPKKLQSSRDQINKALTESKAALDAGKVDEAYLRFVQSWPLADSLSRQAKKEYIEGLNNAITEKRQASLETQADLSQGMESQKTLRDKLTAAETDLKEKEQNREKDLKAGIGTS